MEKVLKLYAKAIGCVFEVNEKGGEFMAWIVTKRLDGSIDWCRAGGAWCITRKAAIRALVKALD